MKNCIVCGKSFEPQSINTKSCSQECRMERNRITSAAGHARKRERAAQIKRAEAEKAQKKPLTIAQTLDLARKAGMSYGKYVAMQKIAL